MKNNVWNNVVKAAGGMFLVGLLIAAGGSRASADDAAYAIPEWEVGLGAGAYFFEGDGEFYPGQYYQLRGTYNMDPAWSVEAYFAGMPQFEDNKEHTKPQDLTGIDRDNWGLQSGVDLNYHFNQDVYRTWDPFVGVGGGAQWFRRQVEGQPWNVFASGNLGVTYRFDPHWTARGEYKLLFVSSDATEWNHIGLLSFGYNWGGEGAAGERVGEEGKSTIDNTNLGLKTVYFDFDSSALRADSKTALRENAEWMKANPNVKVILEGHCDERGTNEYNMALGERRARSAYNYLKTLGVRPEQMTTISYGEERPANPGHDETAWAQNRRVECKGGR